MMNSMNQESDAPDSEWRETHKAVKHGHQSTCHVSWGTRRTVICVDIDDVQSRILTIMSATAVERCMIPCRAESVHQKKSVVIFPEGF